MKKITAKRTHEILDKLEQRFLEGERLSVQRILQEVEELRSTTNVLGAIIAERTVRSWIQRLKRRMRSHHKLWLGNISPNGDYGIVLTEREAYYAMHNYYRLTRGILVNANKLKQEVQVKGLLPFKEERLSLPKPEDLHALEK